MQRIVTTHEVENQSPPLEDFNRYASHPALQEAVAREGAAWAHEELLACGAELGRAEWIRRGEQANHHPPELRLFDRRGNRLDEFEFHPAWHDCLRWLKSHGVATGPWLEPRAGAHVRRAALFQLFGEIEAGSLCPTTMCYGAVPTIADEPAIAPAWLPRLLSLEYDERSVPVEAKRGVLVGMGMTEKQGGSDVRANTTRAEPAGDPGWYRLWGHKWFLSAPMCDAFLVTAQAAGGLTCYFVPRFAPDGGRNALRIQRGKDKLGDRSNASCEVELWGALAQRVGAEGRGVPTVIEMATYTRLDCANGTTALMRAGLAQALHHARHRRAFGAALADQPLMRSVLADLALELEGHVALSMRVAGAFDRQHDEAEGALRRVLTPAAKYWICKRGPAFGAEAMEVQGGNGYVEESVMPRLYRQLPLNSIWEGSANVMCLDVLRALARTPRATEAIEAELAPARGRSPVYDRSHDALRADLAHGAGLEAAARRLVERLALLTEAALLLRHAPEPVAQAFCASRLGDAWRGAYGALPSGLDLDTVLNRAWPPPGT